MWGERFSLKITQTDAFFPVSLPSSRNPDFALQVHVNITVIDKPNWTDTSSRPISLVGSSVHTRVVDGGELVWTSFRGI